MMGCEPGALQQFDRSFRIAQSELQGEVHIAGRGQLRVQTIKRGVVIRSHQPIDDPARKIPANSGLQSVRLEYRAGGGNGIIRRPRLAYDLDEVGPLRIAKPVSCEAEHAAAFLAARFAAVNTQALGAERASSRAAAASAPSV